MNSIDTHLLREIADLERVPQGAYNIRSDGELAGRNAQNISSLIAQAQIANQRICELSLKTDRIVLKMKGGSSI